MLLVPVGRHVFASVADSAAVSRARWRPALACLLVAASAGFGGAVAAEPAGRVAGVREGRNERDGRIFHVHIPDRPRANAGNADNPRLFFWFHGGEMVAQTQFDEWMKVEEIAGGWILVCPQAQGRAWDAGKDGPFVNQLLSQFIEAHGVAPADVIVGGFSQGGSMASLFAFQNQDRTGGLLACACLIARPIPRSRSKMAVMWYYSMNDPYYDMARPVETEREIRDAGYRMLVEKDNVGHAMGARAAVAFHALREQILDNARDKAEP